MDLLTANDRMGEYPDSYYASVATPLGRFEPARGSVRCDVCVVGGGFTGLSTALHLAERGYDVRLVEAQRVGFGASGRNGGQVGQGQRVEQDDLEAMVGLDHARRLWEIGMQSVELVRDLAARPEVHAQFHEGIIHADHKAGYVKHSRAYVEKMRGEYGYEHVSFLDRNALRERVNSPAYHGGMIDTRSGHIDPLELALGLARMAVAAGAKLHEGSRVTEIKEGAIAQVVSEEAEISADYVVLACNGYLGGLQQDVARRIMPINNFIVATEPMSADDQAALIRDNVAVADSKFVVNYFRFSDDRRLLFGGSESYGMTFPTNIEAQVRKPMAQIFPQLADAKIDHAWGGTLGITLNRMPHYARYGGNILSMSGFSGHGVAMGTLSGQIAAETIAGQAERFDVMETVPSPRFPGGVALRQPILVLGMLWYGLLDRL